MIKNKGKENFSTFGRMFQESLAQLILEDRAFADQIGEVLDTNFFEIKYLVPFVEKIYDYKRKYQVHPSREILTTIINNDLDDENELVVEQVKNFLLRTKTKEINDIAYIKQSSLKFCKNQKMKEAILNSVPLVKKGEYDQIEKLIKEAVSLGLEDDDGHDLIADFALRYAEGFRKNLVPSGWPEINKITDGGLAAGEMAVFIAPSGTGKSWLLAHYGASAVKAGYNVIHFTLELPKEIIGRRYDALISEIPLNNLKERQDQVWEKISDVPGHLEIVKYPRNKVTATGIANRIEKIKRKKFKPNLLIIDYGDLVKPVGHFTQKTDALQSVFEEIQGLGEQFGCPVLTATQTNRTGIKAEINELDSIADAFSKVFCANFILTMSRRPQDVENNTGRGYVAKNNLGPDKLTFPLYFDTYTTTRIEFLPEDSYEDHEALSMQTQKDRLKNVWNNLKGT
jgi:replicative DNA helicase